MLCISNSLKITQLCLRIEVEVEHLKLTPAIPNMKVIESLNQRNEVTLVHMTE